mmetsp:Transcript_42335/g.117912  ORF Transcript_42335/g.117912 Transcript_42335/m.117912 type:complete len:269 (+) Transcript_42335:249-1055(+)
MSGSCDSERILQDLPIIVAVGSAPHGYNRRCVPGVRLVRRIPPEVQGVHEACRVLGVRGGAGDPVVEAEAVDRWRFSRGVRRRSRVAPGIPRCPRRSGLRRRDRFSLRGHRRHTARRRVVRDTWPDGGVDLVGRRRAAGRGNTDIVPRVEVGGVDGGHFRGGDRQRHHQRLLVALRLLRGRHGPRHLPPLRLLRQGRGARAAQSNRQPILSASQASSRAAPRASARAARHRRCRRGPGDNGAPGGPTVRHGWRARALPPDTRLRAQWA